MTISWEAINLGLLSTCQWAYAKIIWKNYVYKKRYIQSTKHANGSNILKEKNSITPTTNIQMSKIAYKHRATYRLLANIPKNK